MKLSEETLLRLKILKNFNFSTINELRDVYFISLNNNIEDENIIKLLSNDIWSFKQIVDKFKSIEDTNNDSCLYYLLKSTSLFEELIDKELLNVADLKYLLNTIDSIRELEWLCDENVPLLKQLLKEFVLDTKIVGKFNTMIENSNLGIMTIFDYIEHELNKNGEERSIVEKEDLLKLNELNKMLYIFNFNIEQKRTISETMLNSERTQNILKDIVDNHLEDQYDFEKLKSLLNKDDKKKKSKFNF